jgi:uncharacterized protein
MLGCSNDSRTIDSGGPVRFLITWVSVGLLTTTAAFAQDPSPTSPSETRPSEDSVRRLLEVTQVKKTLQTISEQMDTSFAAMVKKQLGDEQELTPEQQQAIEARRKAAADMIRSLLSWDSMEPLYLKVYEETFSQSEIDGMLEFYATAAGQAVIAKLPLAAKNTMSEMQQRVQQMIPKLQQMARETAEQVKTQGPPKKSG